MIIRVARRSHVVDFSRNGTVFRWRDGAWAFARAAQWVHFLGGGIVSGDGSTFFATVNWNTYVLRGENAQTWQGIDLIRLLGIIRHLNDA